MLAHDARAGIVYEEWLDVEPCPRGAFEIAREAGALLARLHADPAPLGPPTPRHDSGAAIELLRTQPTLRTRTLALPTRASRPTPRWIHGDFHSDQLARARDGGALRLLDLDRLGSGDVLEDLAAWIADHLLERPSDGLQAASSELLAGYVEGGGEPPQARELALAVGEALVQRAAAMLRRLESDAASRAARILDLAREIEPSSAHGVWSTREREGGPR
jgi:aminoglycoside phosphotransferase (APT) family kinase protein